MHECLPRRALVQGQASLMLRGLSGPALGGLASKIRFAIDCKAPRHGLVVELRIDRDLGFRRLAVSALVGGVHFPFIAKHDALLSQ